MKVLITGGTGLVGKQLQKLLLKKGYEIWVITRKRLNSSNTQLNYICWDDMAHENVKIQLLQINLLFHLAGENIAHKRWTSCQQEEIINSRVNTLQELWKFYCQHPNNQLHTLVSASGVGFYGAVTTDKILQEEDGIGMDFLAHVCDVWEQAAFNFESLGVRVVCLRTGLVFAKKQSALQKIAQPIQWGIGAVLGLGHQKVPFVHCKDLCNMYLHVAETKNTVGVYNAVAANTTQEILTKAIAYKLKKKIWLPNIPPIILKLMLGKMASILLEGSAVSNEKIIATGFQFQYNTLNKALRKSF